MQYTSCQSTTMGRVPVVSECPAEMWPPRCTRCGDSIPSIRRLPSLCQRKRRRKGISCRRCHPAPRASLGVIHWHLSSADHPRQASRGRQQAAESGCWRIFFSCFLFSFFLYDLTSQFFSFYRLLLSLLHSFSSFLRVQIDTRMTMHGMARRLICISQRSADGRYQRSVWGLGAPDPEPANHFRLAVCFTSGAAGPQGPSLAA